MGIEDVFRVVGLGLVLAIIHIFFEQTGKKEFAFFIFFIAYIFMTIELLRFLKVFFEEVSQFLGWLSIS